MHMLLTMQTGSKFSVRTKYRFDHLRVELGCHLTRLLLHSFDFLLLALLILLDRALRHPSKVVEHKRKDDIEDNVRPKDAEVSPSISVIGIDLVQEDIRRRDLTERTVVRGGGVLDVSTKVLLVGVQILLASLAGERLEVEVFIGGAGYGGVG